MFIGVVLLIIWRASSTSSMSSGYFFGLAARHRLLLRMMMMMKVMARRRVGSGIRDYTRPVPTRQIVDYLQVVLLRQVLARLDSRLELLVCGRQSGLEGKVSWLVGSTAACSGGSIVLVETAGHTLKAAGRAHANYFHGTPIIVGTPHVCRALCSLHMGHGVLSCGRGGRRLGRGKVCRCFDELHEVFVFEW